MHHVYFIIQLDRIEFGRIYLLLHHQGFREWSRLGIFGGPVATPQVIGVLHWIFFLKLSGDWGVLVEYPLFCHKFVCFTKVPSQTHIYIYVQLLGRKEAWKMAVDAFIFQLSHLWSIIRIYADEMERISHSRTIRIDVMTGTNTSCAVLAWEPLCCDTSATSWHVNKRSYIMKISWKVEILLIAFSIYIIIMTTSAEVTSICVALKRTSSQSECAKTKQICHAFLGSPTLQQQSSPCIWKLGRQ